MDRRKYKQVALGLLDTDIDVLIGSGRQYLEEGDPSIIGKLEKEGAASWSEASKNSTTFPKAGPWHSIRATTTASPPSPKAVRRNTSRRPRPRPSK